MDLVPGVTLDALLAADGPQPFERLARLGGQALEALEEAHRAGIVHRDLKPANVMVTTGRTGEEEARIFDFGVAKAVDAAGPDLSLTRAGCTVGTPTYMSPEQAMGLQLGAPSDVYALAVVLYESLCGCLPYALDVDAEDVQHAIFTALLSDPPLDPREVLSDLPSAAAEVLLTALAKDPARRYPSALAFRDALITAARATADRPTPRRFTAWLGERLRRTSG